MRGGLKHNRVRTRTQRPGRSQATPAFECLGVSCVGTGQQWPAVGTWDLTAADLGHAACGIGLLEEIPISPTTEPLSRLIPPRNMTLEASGT